MAQRRLHIPREDPHSDSSLNKVQSEGATVNNPPDRDATRRKKQQ